MNKGEIEKRVFWKEPIFADNVKIAHVMASKLPGYKMKAGRHDVLYQAADSDGNKARCVFTVTVWDNKYRYLCTLLKVNKFQNENIKSSHCPKYARKNLKILP